MVSKFKAQGFGNTFKNARKGLRLVLKSEVNIRVHFCIAILVTILGVVFRMEAAEFCLLFFAIALVIVTEMMNTAVEFGLDAVFHNRYSKLVGMAKDISAGAVMVATFMAIAIGTLLFGSAILS